MSLKIRKYKKRDEIGFFNLDRELEEHPFNRRSKLNYIWKFNDKNQFGKSISFFATYKKNNCSFWCYTIRLVLKFKIYTRKLFNCHDGNP